jgi:hypothetical protein
VNAWVGEWCALGGGGGGGGGGSDGRKELRIGMHVIRGILFF